MTLVETHKYLEKLIATTNSKAESTIYKEFIQVIMGLEKMTFSEIERQSIEQKLDTLNLKINPRNKKRHFSKALKHFKGYLKAHYNLTTRGYYTTIAVGLSSLLGGIVGILLFLAFDSPWGIQTGLFLGLLIGFLVGGNMDSHAKDTGKIIA